MLSINKSAKYALSHGATGSEVYGFASDVPAHILLQLNSKDEDWDRELFWHVISLATDEGYEENMPELIVGLYQRNPDFYDLEKNKV